MSSQVLTAIIHCHLHTQLGSGTQPDVGKVQTQNDAALCGFPGLAGLGPAAGWGWPESFLRCL